MKKILLLIFTSIFFLFPQPIFAQNNTPKRPQVIVTVPSTQTINDNYYAYGDRIEIMGNIKGDVYLAGGEIVIDGNIDGDLLAVGGMIDVNGKIGQDARIIGGQVNINGEIVKNLSYACGNFQLAKSANVGNSVLAASGNSSYLGSIGKDIRIAAGNLNLNNKIGRDVSTAVGNLRITSNSQIGGKLDYWSDTDASIDETAKISGEVIKHQTPQTPKVDTKSAANAFSKFMIAGKISSFLLGLLIGFLLIKFLPKYMETSLNILQNRLAASMLKGFLFLIIAPIAAIVLMITLIGIPLSLILLATYFVAIYFAKFLIAPYLGRLIFKENKEINFKEFAVGLLIIYLIGIVPIIGGIVNFLILIAGLGALFLTKKEIFNKAREKGII